MKAQDFLTQWKNKNAGNQAGLSTLQTDTAITAENLTDSLEIKDIPELEIIDISAHQIDELTIINCPKLKEIHFENNATTKIDFTKAKTSDNTSNGSPEKSILEEVYLGDNDIKEINFKYSPELKGIFLQNNQHLNQMIGLDELTKTDVINTTGIPDVVRPVHSNKVNYWKEVVKVVKEELGMDPKADFDKDASGKVDFNTLRNKVKNIANQRIEKILGWLGLAKGSSDQQIEEKIEELKDNRPSSDYITKASLISSAENNLKGLGIFEGEISSKLAAAASARDVEVSRNKLVSNRFNELQSKLHNAHYLNIGLGTLSVGVLLILTWMILKDRKLLPSQEEEEVKEED